MSKILLVNPGIYCIGRYSSTPMSPMGLLKIGSYLKEKGHQVKLVDGALVPNYHFLRMPIKSSYPDAPFVDYRPCGTYKQYALEGMMKPIRYYGKPLSVIKKELIEAFDSPDQVWIGSHLTYYYESSWELVSLAKELFPRAKVLLGGIYPTLCPEHASRSGADVVYSGEIEHLESYLPDYSLMPYDCKVKVFKASEGCRVKVQCGFCLPGEEEIYTSSGFKRIDEIKIGDSVLSSNGEFEKVVNKFKRPYEEDLISIKCKNNSIPIKVTKNHKIKTRKGTKEAKDLKKGDLVEISLPKTKKWSGWEVPSFSKLKTPIFDKISPTENAAYLMGLYTAEGCIHYSRGIPSAISFTFNKNETELMFKTQYLIEEVFGKSSSKPSDTGTATQIYLHSKQAASLFEEKFNHIAVNKRIPQDILESEIPILKAYIKGLWDGDGSVFVTNQGYYRTSLVTQSKELAFQAFLALRKLGFKSSISQNQRKNSFIGNREVKYNAITNQVTICCYDDILRFCDDILHYNLPPKNRSSISNSEILYFKRELANKTNKSEIAKKTFPNTSYFHLNKNIENNKEDLSFIKIDSLCLEPFNGYVYNIEVSPSHRYHTSSILVENCAVKSLTKTFRPLNVDSTIDWIQKEFNLGTKNFIMWSSQLLDPPKVFKDFCEKMIATGMPEKGIKLAASEGIQPSLFTDEIASLMRRAGFDDINIPLEAIRSDRIKEYHKPSSLTHVERSIDLAFKYGFKSIKAFIMMATPNQTPEEIVEAIIYCWKRHVRISLMPFTPVPKSEMFEEDEEFKNKPLELLNPFLWPAAHEGLTCQDLERIGEIVNLGFDSWYLKYRNDSKIDSLFLKYCLEYNLISDRKYFIESVYDNPRKTVPAEIS